MSQLFGFLKLDEVKQAVVLDRLKSMEGNKSATAKSLGIHRGTLDKLLIDFEKKDVKDKEVITKNQSIIEAIRNQDKNAFAFDPNTGHSVPMAPPPLQVPESALMKVRPVEGEPVAAAAEAANDAIRQKTKFITQPKIAPPPAAKKDKTVLTEQQRFDKLKIKPMREVPKPKSEKKAKTVKTAKGQGKKAAAAH